LSEFCFVNFGKTENIYETKPVYRIKIILSTGKKSIDKSFFSMIM
jgi:hypothetical protein